MYGLGKQSYNRFAKLYETEGKDLLNPPEPKKFSTGGLMGAKTSAPAEPSASPEDLKEKTPLLAFSLFKNFNESYKKT
jgi:hypothetical protein